MTFKPKMEGGWFIQVMSSCSYKQTIRAKLYLRQFFVYCLVFILFCFAVVLRHPKIMHPRLVCNSLSS